VTKLIPRFKRVTGINTDDVAAILADVNHRGGERVY
jgi:hypothetical protein